MSICSLSPEGLQAISGQAVTALNHSNRMTILNSAGLALAALPAANIEINSISIDQVLATLLGAVLGGITGHQLALGILRYFDSVNADEPMERDVPGSAGFQAIGSAIGLLAGAGLGFFATQ